MSSIVEVQSYQRTASNSASQVTATFVTTPPQDSYIIAVGFVNEQPNPTADISMSPSGFTLIDEYAYAGFVRIAVFIKKAGAGEPKAVQMSLGAAYPCALVTYNISHADLTAPIDVFTHNAGESTGPIDTGSIATHDLVSERWFAAFAVQSSQTPSSPSNSFSSIVNGQVNSLGYMFASRDMPSPSTGPAHSSCTLSGTEQWVGIVFAVKELAPITYIKTGQITLSDSKLSSSRIVGREKTGLLKSDAKIRAYREGQFNKTGTLISEGAALHGARPAFYSMTGKIVVDAIFLTSPYLHVRGATIVRDPNNWVVGLASAKVSTTGIAPYQGAYTTFEVETTGPHTVSIFMQADENMRLRVTDDGGGTIEASPIIPPNHTWTRYSMTTTADLIAGRTYRFYIETTDAVATEFWIDGAQAEESSVLSPFVVGVRPAGQGPIGKILREQKPAGLVMEYIVAPGAPNIYATYQELYDHHMTYTHVMETEQTYKNVYLTP